MNSLSWFLYFAGVVGGISTAIGILAILLIVVSLFGSGVYAAINERWPPTIFGWAAVVGFVLLFLLSFIPSKNTMYAIAASELGQKAVESELGGKALKAVEQWIDSQVKK